MSAPPTKPEPPVTNAVGMVMTILPRMDLPEPAQRLAPSARSVWRIHWALGSIVALMIGRAVSGDLDGVPRR